MVGEARVCACGLEMVPFRLGSDGFRCENCDHVQDSEAGDKPPGRLPTFRDQDFKREWEQRIPRIYPMSERGKAA